MIISHQNIDIVTGCRVVGKEEVLDDRVSS